MVVEGVEVVAAEVDRPEVLMDSRELCRKRKVLRILFKSLYFHVLKTETGVDWMRQVLYRISENPTGSDRLRPS